MTWPTVMTTGSELSQLAASTFGLMALILTMSIGTARVVDTVSYRPPVSMGMDGLQITATVPVAATIRFVKCFSYPDHFKYPFSNTNWLGYTQLKAWFGVWTEAWVWLGPKLKCTMPHCSLGCPAAD